MDDCNCSARRTSLTTESSRPRFPPLREDQASVTLEASLWLPVYLAFALALIALLKICMTDLALEAAVSDSVRTIASSSYPAKTVIQAAAGQMAGATVQQKLEQIDNWYKQVKEWQDMLGLSFLPDSLKDLTGFISDKYGGEIGRAASEPMRGWAADYIAGHADPALIRRDRLEVTELDLPDLWAGGDAYLTVTVRYEAEIALPFRNLKMTLVKQSSERCWIGA